MISDAILVEKAHAIHIFSPKYSKGRPIHILNKSYKDKKIKLVTSLFEIDKDKPQCKCDKLNCDGSDYTRDYLKAHAIPYNTCVTCSCTKTVYLIVPELFMDK